MDLYGFEKELDNIIREYPEAKRKLVENAGDKMYKKVIDNIETSTSSKTGNLKEGVTKVLGSGGGYSAVKPDWNVAPHSHLLENGHWDKDKCTWVEGKHMYRNALDNLIFELENDAEQMVDNLIEALNG